MASTCAAQPSTAAAFENGGFTLDWHDTGLADRGMLVGVRYPSRPPGRDPTGSRVGVVSPTLVAEHQQVDGFADWGARVRLLRVGAQHLGAWVFAEGRQEPQQATVVRQDDGDIVTIDGPFPEAKEQLGGVWIIDVSDHDTALDWARKATQACQGPVEVRPFHPEPEE